MVDSTVIRAHYHAAAAKGGFLKGSRDGFSISIRLRVNGVVFPMRTKIPLGQDSDYTDR